jgi:hypothetical protein
MPKPRFRDDPDTATIGRVVLVEEDTAALREALRVATERIERLESLARFLQEHLTRLTRPRRLITEQEAAAEINVHVNTLRGWRKEKPPRIAFIRTESGKIRYKVEEIESYLKSRERGAKPALRAA